MSQVWDINFMENAHFDDVAVVIPAFNESQKIAETLNEVMEYFKNVIVVDDGSTDNTFETVSKVNVIALKHPINLGQGAALQTGLVKALSDPKINYILTFDADGQHSIDSAMKIVSEIKNSNLDVILGSRFLSEDSSSIPLKKKLILKLGIIFTKFDSGLNVTDTHNGLRVLSRNFAESLNIKHAGMAHASEILNHIKAVDAKWKEFPVQVFYTDYAARKGQSIFNAVNIITEMIYK